MNVKFVHGIEFTPCQSLYKLRLPAQMLPQQIEFNNFLLSSNTSEVKKIVINDRYISLSDLKSKIVNGSRDAMQFLYLSINKFMVYNNSHRLYYNKSDYDANLIEYCHDLLKDNFTMLKSNYRLDDHGQLGNFVYPVTTMFFQRHEQR